MSVTIYGGQSGSTQTGSIYSTGPSFSETVPSVGPVSYKPPQPTGNTLQDQINDLTAKIAALTKAANAVFAAPGYTNVAAGQAIQGQAHALSIQLAGLVAQQKAQQQQAASTINNHITNVTSNSPASSIPPSTALQISPYLALLAAALFGAWILTR